MTDVAIPDPRDLSTLTLDQLAQAAADEYRQAENHMLGVLHHFVRFGEVLLAARPQVPEGEWMRWCEGVANAAGRTYEYKTAAAAMRLAHYRNHLPAEAWQPWKDSSGRLMNASPKHALSYLKGLPIINRKGVSGHPEETRMEARRLRTAGLSYDDIAEMVGASSHAVRMWCEPAVAKRYAAQRRTVSARQRAAARALREKEKRLDRDRLAKITGGELADAYSLIRRALAALDKDGRAPDAILHLQKAEDTVQEAMRTARTA